MKEVIFGVISGIVAATGMGGRYNFNFVAKFIWRYWTTYGAGN